jgi:NADPH:quinone reductase-like Zn-dependent oxidoreductase
MTAIPKTMQAMVLTGHGGLDKYEWHEDWPVPALRPGDVLIKVGAPVASTTPM